MNVKTIVPVLLLFSILLVGCASSNTSGYGTYNQPQGTPPQSGQYVGGGCGVAPNAAYEDTPFGAFVSSNSAL